MVACSNLNVAFGLLFLVAAAQQLISVAGGSVKVTDKYVGRGSSGCGKSNPYGTGRTSEATGTYAGVKWTWRVYVPRSYDKNTPMPVIVQHPGWGLDAKSEEKGAGITDYAESLDFISVTAQGGNDNTHSGGPWYSWNAVGTTQSPGPGGPTCTSKASAPSYCYTSCGRCNDNPQCMWTTCDETGPTPTGTGPAGKDVGGFIPGLYDTLESQLCIDVTREYGAGESNGGMMTYQLGVDLAGRLAAIVPQFGSFHYGWNLSPAVGVPVLDFHGTQDTTVPANVTTSSGGYKYTTTDEIFGGNKFSSGWEVANGCKSRITHYPTKYDGEKNFYCVSVGDCSGGDVIRCSWKGGHNWLFNSATANGYIVTWFALKWAKPSHLGAGRSELLGNHDAVARPLANVTILGPDTDEDGEDGDAALAAAVAAPGAVCTTDSDCAPSSWCMNDDTKVPPYVCHDEAPAKGKQHHYGDPGTGCRDDEDVVVAGTGHVCAMRIGTTAADNTTEKDSHLPVPKCMLGLVNGLDGRHGCPNDARIGSYSAAFPVCLAKGASSDPYSAGQFHCLLACPCPSAGKNGCGAKAHAACPSGAYCERGELLHRAHGVCTYHS